MLPSTTTKSDKHQNYLYVFAYFCIYFTYGIYLSSIGTLIPFYARQTSQDQAYYASLFLFRGLGFIAGGFSLKTLLKHFPNIKYHFILAGTLFCASLCCFATGFSFELFNLALWTFLSSACLIFFEVLCPMCLFTIFTNNKPDVWIQALSITLGVGGIAGPTLIMSFEQQSMAVVGCLLLLCIPAVSLLTSPESQQQSEQHVKLKPLSHKAEICLCLAFMLFVGPESGFSNWIPTFAIKKRLAGIHDAGKFSSYFWTANIISKLFFLVIRSTVTRRLLFLIRGLLITNLALCLMNMLHWDYALTLVGSLGNGIFLSCLYALLLSISIEFGYKCSARNTSNFIIANAMGEGFLVMGIGYSMGTFGAGALIYSMPLFILGIYGAYRTLICTFQEDNSKRENEVHIELIESQMKYQRKYSMK